ncbi:hypothetical protein G9A89_002140 [Geosiphon pyriformis]|nr:hypothetical protein G9A89_002140 [Geosiphon pyriformis]
MVDPQVFMRSAVACFIMIFFIAAVVWSILLLSKGRFFSYTIVVFGDSLSVTNYTNTPSGLYYKGRFSNGRVWVEDVADAINSNVENYAYPYATTDNDIIKSNYNIFNSQNSTEETVSSIVDQVEEFRKNGTDAGKYQTTHMIWAGSNDYMLIVDQNITNVKTEDIVKSIENSLKNLASAGARKFLVNNLPPLDFTPKYANSSREKKETLHNLILDHNNKLEIMVNTFTLTSSRIYARVFNIHNHTMNVINDPGKYEFENAKDPCYVKDNDGNSAQCSNPKKYVFWDDIHPTAAFHQWWADQIIDFLKSRDGSCLFSKICKI